MRFLKNKIALANKARLCNLRSSKIEHIEQFSSSPSATSNTEYTQDENFEFASRRRRIPGLSFTSEKVKVTKNIVINYGRAISVFAISKLSDPYLDNLIKDKEFDRSKFNEYVKRIKSTIGGISSFKAILIGVEKDTREVIVYKEIYKKLAEIFIKFFSVNWIIHGRMGHKEVYLKYRYKMLRRIKNPELFTYLKNLNEK